MSEETKKATKSSKVSTKKEETKQVSPTGLFPKLYALQEKLFGAQVDKTGKNTYSGYQYSTKEDIIKAVATEVRKSGLLFIPTFSDIKTEDSIFTVESKSVTKQEKSTRTTITAKYMIIDPETKEQIDIEFPGSSEDKQDKSVWKTYTGIQKYFWTKLFNLQYEELETEPENDDPRTPTTKAKPTAKTSTPTTAKASDEKARLFEKIKTAVANKEQVNFDKAIPYFKGTEFEAEIKAMADEYAKLAEESGE